MEIVEPAEFLAYGSCQIVPRQGAVQLDGKDVDSPVVLPAGRLALVRVERKEFGDVLALITKPNVVGLSEQLQSIVKLAQNGRGIVFICSFVQRILLQFVLRRHGLSGFGSFSGASKAPVQFIDEEAPDIEMIIQMCADARCLFISTGSVDLSRCTCPIMECRDLVSIATSQIDAVLSCFECCLLPLPQQRVAMAGGKSEFKLISFQNCATSVSLELYESLIQLDLKSRLKAFQAFIQDVWCAVQLEDGSSDEVRCLGLLYANAQWNLCMMSDALQGQNCQLFVLRRLQ